MPPFNFLGHRTFDYCTDCSLSWDRTAWQITSFVVIPSKGLHLLAAQFLLNFIHPITILCFLDTYSVSYTWFKFNFFHLPYRINTFIKTFDLLTFPVYLYVYLLYAFFSDVEIKEIRFRPGRADSADAASLMP